MPDILNTQEHDPCCSRHWNKAAESGALDSVGSWTCPKCGLEWKASLLDGLIRHWEPKVLIEVFK